MGKIIAFLVLITGVADTADELCPCDERLL
jgi:hypothetical protein